jgi:hypothetical protein
MQLKFIVLSLYTIIANVHSFALPTQARRPHTTTRIESASHDAEALKTQLFQKIDLLRAIQALNGTTPTSIEYGVKGGELDPQTRAPQKVNFYGISDATGVVADDITSICHQLAAFNPTQEATRAWGAPQAAEECPLHGPWKLLFSTAADAAFSKNSKRGDAIIRNEVDAVNGWMSNIIDFIPGANAKNKPGIIEQLFVKIKATAINPQRVALEFRYAKITFRRFFFIPKRWSLYIPVPATFLTRLLVWTSRLLRRKSGPKPPKAFFDVLYLDPDVRIHQTGEDNLFVQARPNSSRAKGLLRSM